MGPLACSIYLVQEPTVQIFDLQLGIGVCGGLSYMLIFNCVGGRGESWCPWAPHCSRNTILNAYIRKEKRFKSIISTSISKNTNSKIQLKQNKEYNKDHKTSEIKNRIIGKNQCYKVLILHMTNKIDKCLRWHISKMRTKVRCKYRSSGH